VVGVGVGVGGGVVDVARAKVGFVRRMASFRGRAHWRPSFVGARWPCVEGTTTKTTPTTKRGWRKAGLR